MLIPMIGLCLGVAVGIGSGMVFPPGYSAYVAMGILACLDSVIGGVYANLQGRFQGKIFVTGLFCNGIFAMALIWLGNQLSIDLSLAAVVVYGSRMFHNFSRIRIFLLNKGKKEIMIDAD
ncbi:small basic family protein [Anaerotignum sp.]